MIARSSPGFTLTISDLSWDSEVFGFRCAQFEISRPASARSADSHLTDAIADILEEARAEGVKFVTLKADAEERDTVNSALRNNGFLIDTEITFAKKPVYAVSSGNPRKCQPFFDGVCSTTKHPFELKPWCFV